MSNQSAPGVPPDTHPELTTLLCVASSAGGVGALGILFDLLPGDLPLAIIIVQHLSPDHQSRLSEILTRHTSMIVRPAEDGLRIDRGTVYVAPPGTHVVVLPGGILSLTHTQQVQYVRPSADILLSSAASNFPGRVIAIVLTGMGHDGSDGARSVREAGGIVIAENPDTAAFRSMPESAIATGAVDYVLSLEEIASKVTTILEAGATP